MESKSLRYSVYYKIKYKIWQNHVVYYLFIYYKLINILIIILFDLNSDIFVE